MSSTLAYLEDAARRGAHGTSDVIALDCLCEICDARLHASDTELDRFWSEP